MNGDGMTPEQATEPSPEIRGDAAGAPPHQTLRQRMLRQFEQWLDGMLAGEAPPEGLPDEMLADLQAARGTVPSTGGADGDLYSLFSWLTSLRGEIGLQGRTFKQVSDALAPVAALPGRLEQLEAAQAETLQRLESSQAASLQRLDEFIEQCEQSRLEESQTQEEEPASALPAPEDVLEVLFDLYDRLERSAKTLSAATQSLREGGKMSWLARLGGGPARIQQAIAAMDATVEGQRMTLSRLEAAMHEWGIQRIGRSGEMFDPRRMTAVDVQERGDVADGTVLDVYRSGYVLHEQVLATAQVKVAKSAGEKQST